MVNTVRIFRKSEYSYKASYMLMHINAHLHRNKSLCSQVYHEKMTCFPSRQGRKSSVDYCAIIMSRALCFENSS